MEEQNTPQITDAQPPATFLQTSTLAIVSLVAGILGFTMLPLIGSIVAIIAGYAARKETRSVPPTASGDGIATAGIVMGYVQIGLGVLALCCFLAFMVFGLVMAASSHHGY